mmetsp:Transcript_38272/g.97245  ORF Transcript_38272/g.97245 Transcript_38272/m.97245 type:complete len:203 (-) Transcript_38272:284-892(-)
MPDAKPDFKYLDGFIPSFTFAGPKPGYVHKNGARGVGYYLLDDDESQREESEKPAGLYPRTMTPTARQWLATPVVPTAVATPVVPPPKSHAGKRVPPASELGKRTAEGSAGRRRLCARLSAPLAHLRRRRRLPAPSAHPRAGTVDEGGGRRRPLVRRQCVCGPGEWRGDDQVRRRRRMDGQRDGRPHWDAWRVRTCWGHSLR